MAFYSSHPLSDGVCLLSPVAKEECGSFVFEQPMFSPPRVNDGISIMLYMHHTTVVILSVFHLAFSCTHKHKSRHIYVMSKYVFMYGIPSQAPIFDIYVRVLLLHWVLNVWPRLIQHVFAHMTFLPLRVPKIQQVHRVWPKVKVWNQQTRPLLQNCGMAVYILYGI